MGKTKNKKKAKATVPDLPEQAEENRPTGSISTQAMDGHNVDGWTESQVAAYNELLIEREKLEKQRKEFEIKSAKSHAGRALLNENVTNIDSVFKLQKPTGDYKYTGSNPCCVELSSTKPCQHEICTRSRTEGVSYNELDTMKYYAMRITAEKTERRREALRKQRDSELIKIKKDEDDGRAASIRKSAARNKPTTGSAANPSRGNHKNAPTFEHDILTGATKETQRLVTNILEQLDDLRMDLQAGRISTTEMQKKLDTIDEEMQAAQLKPPKSPMSGTAIPSMSHQDIMSSTKAFQNHIKDRIINTKGDTYSKAFHIMEHFLSASKPGDFQAAVSELKDVLRLSGPMGDELQKSFDALEGIFDSPDRLSFTGPEGKQECSSIIDLMAKMKDTLQRTGKLPEGANSELVSVFEECIKLEADGKTEMMQEFRIHTTQTVTTELSTVLVKIKSEMVAKSPIPPLTEQKLGDEMQSTLDLYDARHLMLKVQSGMAKSQLDGFVTMLVMNRAQKLPEKYVETIGRFAQAYSRLREGLQDQGQYRELEDAFTRVEMKMQAFVAKLAEKKATAEAAATPGTITNASMPSAATESINNTHSEVESEYEDRLPSDVHEVIQAAVEKFVHQDPTSDVHLKLRSYIREHGQMGLWPLWLAWSDGEPIDEDLKLQNKALEYEDRTRLIMEDSSQGLKSAVVHLFELGVCPGMCAGVISQLITDIADSEPDQARLHMRQLADCLQELPAPVTREWSRLFQYLALAMTQLYVGLYTNASLLFPSISPLQFGISSMSMVVSYICLTRSKEGAVRNFRLMWTFVNTCMSVDGMERSKEFYQVAQHFLTFCEDGDYRCLTLEPCSKHMTPAARAGSPGSLPSSLKVGVRSKNTHPASQDSGLKHIRALLTKSAAMTLMKMTNKERELRHLESTSRTTILKHSRLAKSDTKIKLAHTSRYKSVFERAVQIYESTARKALKLMRVGIHGWEVNKLNAPHDLNKVMDDMLQLSGIDSPQPIDTSVKEDESKASRSRFSEQIDELQLQDLASVKGVKALQNLIETSEWSTSYAEWCEALSCQIKDDALSGRWPDPLQRVRRINDRFKKTGSMPETLMNVMGRTQADVEKAMQTSDARQQHETKRFRFWLTTVHAQTPTPQALYDLANGNNGTFEDYCALLARVKAEQGHLIEDIRNLCSETLELVGSNSLNVHSKCITMLAKVALQDWVSRGEIGSSVQVDQKSKPPPLYVAGLDDDAADHAKGYNTKSEFVNSTEESSMASLQSTLGSPAITETALQTQVSLRPTVSQMSVINECNEVIAEEQTVELECDSEEPLANVTEDSHSADESDELSQTETVTPANALVGQYGVNGSIKNKPVISKSHKPDVSRNASHKGKKHPEADTDTTESFTTITRSSYREYDIITQLAKLSLSVNQMKASDNEHRKKVGHDGGLISEQFKVSERVTASLEERLMISRDIAGTIAETRNYNLVKRYLKQGYTNGHKSLWS